jgi:hypothetical protein
MPFHGRIIRSLSDEAATKIVEIAGVTVPDGQSAVRPFNISIPNDMALEIYGISVDLCATATDLIQRYQWTLIAKSESRSDGVAIVQDAPGEVASDQDAIISGLFDKAQSSGQSSNLDSRFLVFPRHICIPRSPTFVFHNYSGGSRTVNLVVTLFYKKVSVTREVLTQLLKLFVGRKQLSLFSPKRSPGVDEGFNE